MSESDFASNYLLLLSLSANNTIEIPSDFSVPLKSLSSVIIPKLPKLPISYNSNNTITKEEPPITVTFKSIKPPKFNLELRLSPKESIYEIKKLLNEKIEGLNQYELKLLIKGKVLKDGDSLNEFGDDIKVTVMTSKQTVTSDVSEASTPKSEEAREEVKRSVELPWNDILNVLKQSGFSEIELNRLQKGWELTK